MSNGVKMVRRMSAAALCALAFLGGIWALTGVLTTPVAAVAGINEQINFQGRLFNGQGAVVPDGYYNIQFKIYQDGDGLSVGNTTGSPAGSLKWTESFLNTNGKGVQVKNGYMSVELGSVNPFGSQVDWNQSTLWLSMNIGSTNVSCASFAVCTPDGEMTPMKRLSSTPYAMNAGKLGGLTSAGFIQNTTSPQTADFSITGGGTASILTGTTSVLSPVVDTASAVALNIGATNASGVTIGKSAGTTTLASAIITLGTPTSATTLSAATQSTANTQGSALTIRGATGNGTGAGGNLTVAGGAGGATNANGGDLTLAGGTATGTGVNGLVKLGASAYSSVTNTPCAANCTLTQANVDNYGTVIISASTAGVTLTLPNPTTTTSGRIVYLTTSNASLDFTLRANSGGDIVDVAMRKNTTATMIWNGTTWTPGGASNATTLQATYNNGTNPSTTPEIKLDTVRGTIDIQDADTTIGADILNIRGSNGVGLGTVLFGVSNTGRVTIQGTAAQDSAFRVLDSTGNYTLNVNSSNGYILNNSTRTSGNEISNPNFEAGGSITSGEEGWFGPAQASIVNNNANTGNYALAVTANTANMDVYGGTFYEIKPTENVYFQGYVKNSAGTNVGAHAGVQITWYDKDKNILSYASDYSSTPGTSYVLRKASGVAPANAAYYKVSATVRANATSGTFYFDDFYMTNSTEIADSTFRNASDSTTAFRIQSASSAQTLFTADTTNNVLKVGDNTGTNTATTILVVDGATADPTTLTNKNGGLFYRSDTGSLKAIIGGAVVDVCTTAVTCSGYSASASSAVQLQGTSPGAKQTGNFNITGTGMLTRLQSQDESTGSTNSSALNITTGNATGATSNSGNLVLDVGTATGARGSITIGTGNVGVTMGGSLNVQGSNALSLGTASTASGSILFRNSAGSNTITLRAPGANPTASYNLTLPQNLGSAGDCLKDSGSGALAFSSCSSGTTTNMQDVYNNSSSPATVTLADGKNIVYNAQDTTTDPSILFNLNCVTSCGANGKFEVQNGGNPVFTVSPNGGGITLNAKTQIGSNTTDGTQTNLQLDSYNGASDTGTCDNTTNQGSLYYNSTTGTIRACVASGWTDISNPEQLGLLSFGVVPQSGSQPYDLPSLQTPGASGPCKVSRTSATQITWEACTAYSGGVRIAVAAPVSPVSVSGAINTWQHLCMYSNGQPTLSSAVSIANYATTLPTFSVSAPVLCIADIKMSATTSNNVGLIYDTRTFTSAIKEAVTMSTLGELGSVMDSGSNGALVPATSGSAKLYASVVAMGNTASTTSPNGIVTTTGPAWIKAIAGTAGQFTKTSTTNGYVDTIASVPNNSFYYSAGNTRTSYNATCTNAATCTGSLYVNLIVR
ncbi:hypothetical protein H7142_00970 [Candidatus Saccharibacteria bacterium]|nr:hypothetical protein [Candidatus Saccharibacteria bacterium]